jgi:hypothetical protein
MWKREPSYPIRAGFFKLRKHVARGPDSIFRSVADELYLSQSSFKVVKAVVEDFLASCDIDVNVEHKIARAVSKIFNIDIEIVNTSDPFSTPFIVTPEFVFNDVIHVSGHEDDGL